MQSIKCVVVGDAGIGKSCMLQRYTKGCPPAEYIPTIKDNLSTLVEIDGNSVNLVIWDTAGQEGYDYLRPMAYLETDIFLICFSVVNSKSFRNVKLKWHKELKRHCSAGKVILVGTKTDLRNDADEESDNLRNIKEIPVTYDEGVEMAKKINALQYLECSALTKVGLAEVFDAVVRNYFLLNPRPRSKKETKLETFNGNLKEILENSNEAILEKNKTSSGIYNKWTWIVIFGCVLMFYILHKFSLN